MDAEGEAASVGKASGYPIDTVGVRPCLLRYWDPWESNIGLLLLESFEKAQLLLE